MTNANPTERFSDRVENYVKYRPSYSAGILPFLKAKAGFRADHVIADIGSGTGILARLFLEHGNPVFGVEPNAKMRAAGEQFLAGYPRFTSIVGTAEATTLQASSIDLITAGQAFHWFEPAPTRKEFERILRPGGAVALIWNERSEEDPLGREYEDLLKTHGIDYEQIGAQHRSGEEPVREFFSGGGDVAIAKFPNGHDLDFQGFEGRMLSASYAPPPGHPGHGPMLEALKALFARHQKGGKVRMEYETLIYLGRFA